MENFTWTELVEWAEASPISNVDNNLLRGLLVRHRRLLLLESRPELQASGALSPGTSQHLDASDADEHMRQARIHAVRVCLETLRELFERQAKMTIEAIENKLIMVNEDRDYMQDSLFEFYRTRIAQLGNDFNEKIDSIYSRYNPMARAPLFDHTEGGNGFSMDFLEMIRTDLLRQFDAIAHRAWEDYRTEVRMLHESCYQANMHLETIGAKIEAAQSRIDSIRHLVLGEDADSD